jgi:hypothetical protein
MRAFHGDINIKNKYVARVDAHIKADNLIRGQGWNGQKGCAVGCTLEKYVHSAYETELGIPEWLARVEDTLFEGMSHEKSKSWPKVFLKAIKPGVDLEKAKAPFLIMVLRHTLENFDHDKFPEVYQSVQSVIDLYEIGEADNQDFTEAAEAASSAAEGAKASWAASWAAWAASWAAEAASWAASWAAWAARVSSAAEGAAWAARAVYDYFADELIKILKSETLAEVIGEKG